MMELKRRNVIHPLIVSLIVIFSLAGCSEDDPTPSGTGLVNLSLEGSGSGIINTGGRTSGRTNAEIVISNFKISVRDVVFKTDNDDDGVADDSTEVLFRGPYPVDLMIETDALKQTIGNSEVPVGTYEELRFKLHKSTEVSNTDQLYDRSIFLSGSIDGIPFEMWHDTSENLDVGKSTGVIVDENGVSITVVFTVNQFFDGVDLSKATDGNGDGLIEISPTDDDGNNDLADELKDNIKDAADLLDE